MTIRHLKIFTAVADYGGMSKAAKMLHISQRVSARQFQNLRNIME